MIVMTVKLCASVSRREIVVFVVNMITLYKRGFELNKTQKFTKVKSGFTR